MQQKAGKLARTLIGWILLGVGLAGLALPFLQGIVLLVLGAYVLSLDSRWFKEKLIWLADKDVRVASAYRGADRRIRKLFGISTVHNHDHN